MRLLQVPESSESPLFVQVQYTATRTEQQYATPKAKDKSDVEVSRISTQREPLERYMAQTRAYLPFEHSADTKEALSRLRDLSHLKRRIITQK